MIMYRGYFDGSAKPNPGIMTIGGLIKNPDSTVLHSYSEELSHGTNNEAEYLSFLRLLNNILERGIKQIQIYGDSILVVNQVNGKWKAKDSRMKTYRNQALKMLVHIPEWKLQHVKRELNKEADLLTR